MQNDKAKSAFWLLIDLFILGLTVAVIFSIPLVSRLGQVISPGKTITVNAQGKAVAVPDVAKTSFSVVSRGGSPASLAESNNQKMKQAVDFLKEEGVDPKDIKTTTYNLQPVYEYDEETRRSYIAGYSLTQGVTVTIRDLSKISKIIGELPSKGVNEVSDVSFEVDDPEAAKSEARREAFEKAKAKAEEIARAGGIRLGEIVGVTEDQGPIYYDRGLYKESLGIGGGGDATAPAPLEIGSQEIVVNVYLTYALK